MTYRDRTFCVDADKCATFPCTRRLTKEDEALLAKQTWQLVAWMHGAAVCSEYKPKGFSDIL